MSVGTSLWVPGPLESLGLFGGLTLSGPVGQLLDVSSKLLQRCSVHLEMVHHSQLLVPVPAIEHLHNVCVPHLCRMSAACPFMTWCVIFFLGCPVLVPHRGLKLVMERGPGHGPI
jgi:hypothetical protein